MRRSLMSRRRTGPGGAFDGIVFGSFLPKYFERHWETLAAGADLHLGLLRADGRVLAHLPAAPSTDSRAQPAGHPGCCVLHP